MNKVAPEVKERVTSTYSDNPVVEFLVRHHACDFAYQLIESLKPGSLAEAWDKGDARMVMFLYVKGSKPKAETFFAFADRMVQFLYEQGGAGTDAEGSDAESEYIIRVGQHLALQIYFGREMTGKVMSWNEALINEITMDDRREVHASKLPSLELNLARRVAYYVMDIVHQTLAGTFNLGLSHTLADMFRQVVGDNPFTNAPESI